MSARQLWGGILLAALIGLAVLRSLASAADDHIIGDPLPQVSFSAGAVHGTS